MKKKFSLGLAIALVMALVLPVAAFAAPQATGAVCPAGNVKYEIDDGDYEYTDGSATVSGDATSVTVSAADGYEIVSVCIKIGGPDGGETFTYQAGGTFGPYDYGISHVVVTTRPAVVPVSNLQLTSICWEDEATHRFRVRNSNSFPVDYEVMVYGVTGWVGGYTAPPGDSFFTIAGAHGSPNTTKIRWQDEAGVWKETVKATNQNFCPQPASLGFIMGECEYIDGQSLTPYTWNFTGASVTVNPGGLLPDSGVPLYLPPGGYSWSATANSGYFFEEGTPTGGEFTAGECVPGEEPRPTPPPRTEMSTGPESALPIGPAIGLLGSITLFVSGIAALRRRRS